MIGRPRALPWYLIYLALLGAPLVLAASVEVAAPPAGWMFGAGAALGFSALALFTIQLALASRMRWLSRAIGLDALMQFHRDVAVVGLAAVVIHPLLSGGAGRDVRAWFGVGTGDSIAWGAASLWLVVLIALTSYWRKPLRLSYEAWQVVHLSSAVLIAGLGTAHALVAGRYAGAPPVRWTLVAYGVLFAALLVRYRIVRPLRLLARPWDVVANTDAGGSTRLITVRPVGHRGFSFEPGQFAWIATARSPLFSEQHPLSIASAPSDEETTGIQFAIKALGDWSAHRVPALGPGDRVWIDGPYGAFTPSRTDTPIVLVAGGIGIAPMRSILHAARTAAPRRIILFYAASDATRQSFGDELQALTTTLNLSVVHVYERPPADWTGERGLLTADLIRRHVGDDASRAEYFVCGPIPMIDAFDRIRAALRVPRARVHTERFQMV